MNINQLIEENKCLKDIIKSNHTFQEFLNEVNTEFRMKIEELKDKNRPEMEDLREKNKKLRMENRKLKDDLKLYKSEYGEFEDN